MLLRQITRQTCRNCRHSSTLSPSAIASLDQWIATEKKLMLKDVASPYHLANLYSTLPTRDGSLERYVPPKVDGVLSSGHHLVFFRPGHPERALRPDGTTDDFCPPEPFTRRMWAGGKFSWPGRLYIGNPLSARWTVSSVEKKGFDTDAPKVFVKQHIEYSGSSRFVALEEERTHVYLAAPASSRSVKSVDHPEPKFSLKWRPSATTLFRFSALTFNSHFIHLDKEYAQKVEGYSERLVHGPLIALMLLETARLKANLTVPRDLPFHQFEYRAWNPIALGSEITFAGAWEDEWTLRLWAQDQDGVVGMTAKAIVRLPLDRSPLNVLSQLMTSHA